MTTEATDLVTEVEELLAKATPESLTLLRYDNGGGRLRNEQSREVIADFYLEGDRELYYAAPELLRRLVEEVKLARPIIASTAELGCLRGRKVHCAEREANSADWCIACQAKCLVQRVPNEEKQPT